MLPAVLVNKSYSGNSKMEFETILFDIADGVATITLNRPDVMNSLNAQILDDLLAAIDIIRNSEDVRALMITGSGRGFCAGADLASGGHKAPFADQQSIGQGIGYSLTVGYNAVIQGLHDLPLPKICAVNGVAAGGGVGVALSADIVLAAESAKFIQVFVPQLGLIPDCGATWFVPHRVGRARAMGLAMLGEKLDAKTAEEWGLIWKAVPDEDLMAEARDIAVRLANGPTQALNRVSRVITSAMENDLASQLHLEQVNQIELGNTEDFREGVSAFIEKRKPVFKGK